MTAYENERLKDDDQRFWEVVDDLRKRNADKDPGEIYEDVTRVTEAVRQRHYEKQKASDRPQHTVSPACSDPSWSILLIGGSSSTGKSILARELGRRFGVPWLQVDDLRLALERSRVVLPENTEALYFFPDTPDVWAYPPEELCDALIAVGRILEPAIEIVIQHHTDLNLPIIIEGDGILPSILERPAIQGRLRGGAIRTVFLSETDEEALLANFMSRNRGIEGRHIDELRTEARAKALFGKWIEEQARTRDCPVLNSRPWESIFARVLSAVDASDHPSPAGR